MTLAEDTLRLTLWYGNYSTQSIPSFLSYVYWLNFWMQWGLPVEEGQVEGSKIGIKVFIDELVVNAKVVCVCRTFGLDRSLEGDKIKPLLDIFTCTHQHICSLVHGGCFKGWFCLCDVRLYLSQIFTSHYLSLCVHSVLFYSWNMIHGQETSTVLWLCTTRYGFTQRSQVTDRVDLVSGWLVFTR